MPPKMGHKHKKNQMSLQLQNIASTSGLQVETDLEGGGPADKYMNLMSNRTRVTASKGEEVMT